MDNDYISLILDTEDVEITTDGNSQKEILDRLVDGLPEGFNKFADASSYITLPANSIEFAREVEMVVSFYQEMSIINATREGLLLWGDNLGLPPYPATPAVFKGRFNIPVAPLTEFSPEDDYNYNLKVIRAYGDPEHPEELEVKDGSFYYLLEALEPGSDANRLSGRLTPALYISGLEEAELVELAVPGEDEEETEHYRARLLDRLRHKGFGGNLSDYIQEITSFPGIGKCKVIRCPDGKKLHVDVVITDSEYNSPSDELVTDLQNYLFPRGVEDPELRSTGNGIAPIGHLVKVKGVEPVEVVTIISLRLDEGVTLEDVSPVILESIEEYFRECISASWGDTTVTERAKHPDKFYLTLADNRLGVKLLRDPRIINYSSITFGGKREFDLNWDQIPVTGRTFVALEE